MNILHLAFQIGISKKLHRTGWLMKGIKNPESVAEHCFRVSVLSMVMAKTLDVDQEKLTKMAIIHDIGETATGDLVVQTGAAIDKKERIEKEKVEREAIRHILFGYGEDYSKLFQEMINRKTREAVIFHELDQLEKAIQAYEYEKEYGLDLSEFIIGAEANIKHPSLKKVIESLKMLRKKKKVKNGILDLALQVGISKRILRTGWVVRKVKDPESVAEHCFRVIVMCLVLAPAFGIDEQKLVNMGIIHDLGETSTGDLVVESWRKVFIKKRDVKEKLEKEAIKDIFKDFGNEYFELFEEMIDRNSVEAKLFWQIDNLERTIQAFEYERSQGINMIEFVESADEFVTNPLLREVLGDLKKIRISEKRK